MHGFDRTVVTFAAAMHLVTTGCDPARPAHKFVYYGIFSGELASGHFGGEEACNSLAPCQGQGFDSAVHAVRELPTLSSPQAGFLASRLQPDAVALSIGITTTGRSSKWR